MAATVNEIIGPKYTTAGSVEGTLQAINSHGMLFFNIYDRSLRITPAMAAGVTERVWELADLLAA